jgi:hypothetical protein
VDWKQMPLSEAEQKREKVTIENLVLLLLNRPSA